MDKCTFVTENTDRPNIRYSVIHTKKEISTLFQWLIDEIRMHGINTQRILIFGQKKRQCTDLFELFKQTLGDDMYFTPNGEVKDDRTSIVGMYHHGTLSEQKDTANKAFTSSDNHPMRVLFCTSSFGLGVNVKDCHLVIHLGPPEKLDEFIQESGRVGRDGLPSNSITLVLPDSTKGAGFEDVTKLFIKSSDMCRRKILMEAIENPHFSPLEISHSCCDICSNTCKCLCMCDESSSCTCIMKCVDPTHI